MGQRAPEERPAPAAEPIEPGWGATLLLVLAVFVALVANGRPIGAGDTRPTEYLAASLVHEHDFDLDEYAEVVTPPFAQDAGEHRVSTYPVLSAVLALPVFAAASAVFALDETGTALAGKLAASLFSALAAGVLFRAVARRRPLAGAALTAVFFALGTTVWSTSQALWQHPAAVLFVSVTLLFLMRAEHDERWAGRAGLPLALIVAARHADVALAAALGIALAVRWPRQIPFAAAWAAPVVVLQALYQWTMFGSPFSHGFSGSLAERFTGPWGAGHLGLLVSPGKGLLVFTPVVIVAIVGLVRGFRRRTDVAVVRGPEGYQSVLTPGDRALAATAAAAAIAHWLFVGRWSEWHGGESFGPRMLTDLLPLLFVFLPDGLDVLPRTGLVLGTVSVGVQALGAFSYDYRWERLHQRGAEPGHAELWQPAESPILFHAREGVFVFAVPIVRDGRVRIHEHRVVLGDTPGSRLTFGDGQVRVSGADRTFHDVHLQRGARVEGGRLRLRGRWDALFLRLWEGAAPRKLELRIRGRGEGVLYVGEQSFLGSTPEWKAYPVSGAIRVRHPYQLATAAGPELLITTGKSPGRLEIESVALVAPGDPENPYQLGGE